MNPSLIDIVHAYVSERMPKQTFTIDNEWLRLDLTRLDCDVKFSVALVGYNYVILTLPNHKVVRIDVYAEDSLDVIYRIIRLDVARQVRSRYTFARSLRAEFPSLYTGPAWCSRRKRIFYE